MSSPIPAIYKSVVRATVDLIEVLNAAAIYPEPITYHNFEERTPEIDLPENTLLGIDGFSFEENDGRWVIRYALSFSSFRDTSLHYEIDAIGIIHDRFGEGKKVDLLRLSDGEVGSELLVSAYRMMPMSQSEQRNYRIFGIELLRTGT